MTSGVSRVARSHSFRPYRSFGAIVNRSSISVSNMMGSHLKKNAVEIHILKNVEVIKYSLHVLLVPLDII